MVTAPVTWFLPSKRFETLPSASLFLIDTVQTPTSSVSAPLILTTLALASWSFSSPSSPAPSPESAVPPVGINAADPSSGAVSPAAAPDASDATDDAELIGCDAGGVGAAPNENPVATLRGTLDAGAAPNANPVVTFAGTLDVGAAPNENPVVTFAGTLDAAPNEKPLPPLPPGATAAPKLNPADVMGAGGGALDARAAPKPKDGGDAAPNAVVMGGEPAGRFVGDFAGGEPKEKELEGAPAVKGLKGIALGSEAGGAGGGAPKEKVGAGVGVAAAGSGALADSEAEVVAAGGPLAMLPNMSPNENFLVGPGVLDDDAGSGGELALSPNRKGLGAAGAFALASLVTETGTTGAGLGFASTGGKEKGLFSPPGATSEGLKTKPPVTGAEEGSGAFTGAPPHVKLAGGVGRVNVGSLGGSGAGAGFSTTGGGVVKAKVGGGVIEIVGMGGGGVTETTGGGVMEKVGMGDAAFGGSGVVGLLAAAGFPPAPSYASTMALRCDSYRSTKGAREPDGPPKFEKGSLSTSAFSASMKVRLSDRRDM